MFKFDSRKAQIIFIAVWFSIFVGIYIVGWGVIWSALPVPMMFPEFADMRTVQGAIYSLNEGFDPQISNPGDPWGRRMNYPSVWISISELLNLQIELHFKVFVSTMVLLFLGCLLLMVKSQPSLTLLLLCFSSATLLAVERGNNDILIFSLLYLSSITSGGIYVLALFAATLLKIYPVLAFPAFFRSIKASFLLLIAAAVAMIFLLPELGAIRNGTPTSASLSYGSASISAVLERYKYNIPAQYISMLVLFLAWITWRVKSLNNSFTFTEVDDRVKKMFMVGSCVYVGTFILSSNWDYRLIFLIFCVPYITSAHNYYLRNFTCLCLVCAFNAHPLHFVLGPISIWPNILSKLFLAVFCIVVMLIELRERLVFITKPAN